MREYQRRRRARQRLASVTIELTRRQRQFVMKMRRQSSYPPEKFLRKALVTGAAFLFNSGARRGGKTRVKPPRTS